MTEVHEVAMFEVEATHVFVRLADERDDDPNVTNGNMHHRHLLDLDEPWVQVPRTGEQNLLLQSAPSAAINERLGILKVVVTGNDRPGNFAGFNRRAIQRGGD